MQYAKYLETLLRKKDIRVTIDDRDQKMNYKIRESQTKKIPYTIIVGDQEKENQKVTQILSQYTDEQLLNEVNKRGLLGGN